MAVQDDTFKNWFHIVKNMDLYSLASEIYDGPGAVYDYGPYGAQLRNHIKEYCWERHGPKCGENIVGSMQPSLCTHYLEGICHVGCIQWPLSG